ncbi:MAG: hypothetical protein QGG09_20240, partial [Pirellulaceae bacterium]|nr:hypothetical protein [Pirellulaceae bacterium]
MAAWKFARQAEKFHRAVDEMIALGISSKDFIHQNTAFAGTATIARNLCIYEIYKNVLDVNGHIAEIGSYNGASLLYLAKLAEIFEPHSNTHVHGFDWFQGMEPGEQDPDVSEGAYAGVYE